MGQGSMASKGSTAAKGFKPGSRAFAGKGAPRRPGRPAPRSGRERPRHAENTVILYGWHPVSEALRNPARRIRRLLATENAAKRLAEAGLLDPSPEIVRPAEIDRLVSADAVHQGLYAECDPLESPELDAVPTDGIVLVLDQVTDPHNVGAIVRSAAAFAVRAIVTTNRHSPEATGVLAKAASGGLEHTPLVTVQNLARALEGLRDRGFTLVGLDSNGDVELGDIELTAPVALVLGAEGKGLRQKTRETCDRLARIDLPGRIDSLNVSNAAALALYVASRAIKR
ncbi:23S rRNA (guanosine(2251)-2'-O)-methyltransferase RlmB [Blastochloris sulfoviridis]|uniref:23S rRNA (Guanosine(2251)-2'-O)-methyltransferase RlmB n=2 Tax=Blastochloris sulfoviridis TaxID=50712 RepID=A0A5M6I1Y4_9HYPH|nr:23S rRNA (guanosine(2251)-2'-O)-methyltransferase RlmB [Blastochloris sulfoviridis]